jgi:hypothetical protein
VNPIRKSTISGTVQEYQFDELATRFLVKNFSGGNIKVSFDPPGDGVADYLIPDGAWQTIPGYDNQVIRKKIYVTAEITSSTGVEIEAVEYQLPRG